jgi:hypothetical protein
MIANTCGHFPVCEEDALSIHKIIARPSSGVTRGFTIVDAGKAQVRKPESAAAESAAPAQD